MAHDRAQRRADFERRAKRGLKRFAYMAWRNSTLDVPDWKRRRAYLKAWCSCWMCSPSERDRSPQELRFLCEPISPGE